MTRGSKKGGGFVHLRHVRVCRRTLHLGALKQMWQGWVFGVPTQKEPKPKQPIEWVAFLCRGSTQSVVSFEACIVASKPFQQPKHKRCQCFDIGTGNTVCEQATHEKKKGQRVWVLADQKDRRSTHKRENECQCKLLLGALKQIKATHWESCFLVLWFNSIMVSVSFLMPILLRYEPGKPYVLQGTPWKKKGQRVWVC